MRWNRNVKNEIVRLDAHRMQGLTFSLGLHNSRGEFHGTSFTRMEKLIQWHFLFLLHR